MSTLADQTVAVVSSLESPAEFIVMDNQTILFYLYPRCEQ